MTLRHRIIVAMIPLFALLLALGGTATFLIYHLGDRIDRILRENYDSVRYMRDLNEALERIDSSFQFTLAGREKDSFKQYEDNWKSFDDCVTNEQNNITLPGEAELVENLTAPEPPLSPAGRQVFRRPQPGSRSALLWPAESAGPVRLFSRNQGRIRRDSQDQPGQHGASQPECPATWRDRHCSGTARAWDSA